MASTGYKGQTRVSKCEELAEDELYKRIGKKQHFMWLRHYFENTHSVTTCHVIAFCIRDQGSFFAIKSGSNSDTKHLIKTRNQIYNHLIKKDNLQGQVSNGLLF